MIITLTPFPSIEYIYSVDELISKQIQSSKSVSLSILSKGIYSAQIMKVLQEEPILISSFGGFAGKSIKHYLDKAKIKSDIVWTEYETPHQVKILLQNSMNYYELRSQEAMMREVELAKLTYKLRNHIKKVSTLVLSGEFPDDVNSHIYYEWIREAKAHNVKVVVSTGQKEVWEQIIREKPYTVFFTENQLNGLGFRMGSEEEILQEMIPYLGEGLHYICIYLKNKGAMVISKSKYCFVESTVSYAVKEGNTAMSGAFLGALAISVNRKYEQEKMAKLCLAAAMSADDNVKHKICIKKDIDYRYKKTRVRQILP